MSTLDSLYDALTIKAQTVAKDITKEIVKDWVSNAGTEEQQITFMSVALIGFQNGRYTAEELVEDILQLAYLDN